MDNTIFKQTKITKINYDQLILIGQYWSMVTKIELENVMTVRPALGLVGIN
jgi:hypothetical protein